MRGNAGRDAGLMVRRKGVFDGQEFGAAQTMRGPTTALNDRYRSCNYWQPEAPGDGDLLTFCARRISLELDVRARSNYPRSNALNCGSLPGPRIHEYAPRPSDHVGGNPCAIQQGGGWLCARTSERQQPRLCVRGQRSEREGCQHDLPESRRHDAIAESAGRARIKRDLRARAIHGSRHLVTGRSGVPDHRRNRRQSSRFEQGSEPLVRDRPRAELQGGDRHQCTVWPEDKIPVPPDRRIPGNRFRARINQHRSRAIAWIVRDSVSFGGEPQFSVFQGNAEQRNRLRGGLLRFAV